MARRDGTTDGWQRVVTTNVCGGGLLKSWVEGSEELFEGVDCKAHIYVLAKIAVPVG